MGDDAPIQRSLKKKAPEFQAQKRQFIIEGDNLAIELQGRLPIQVKMAPLTVEDFKQILSETKHNLLIQQIELLRLDGLEIAFSQEAIDEMATVACLVNTQQEDIGARRLLTVVDSVMDEFDLLDQQLHNKV